MNTPNPSTDQEKQKQTAETTMYKSSRTPLHNFMLNDLVWGTRNLLQCVKTRPNISSASNTKLSPVSKPCIKATRCKRQAFSRPVNGVVQERRVRRRECLFSLSLRNEVIEDDFVCLTGEIPERKIKVKKVYKDDQKKECIDYQKYLKDIVPGNWMSEIYEIPRVQVT
ncbi:uncharacterized protein LOC141670892 [Apium graveolens]|uniref:uncharacterized protein LOC141670892 n=1 Tax=Apium graveolens TaxID=4045 RepID=UPI003D799546